MTQPNPIRQRQLSAKRRRSPLVPIALTALIAAGAAAGATAVFSSRAQDTTQKFVEQLGAGVNASGVATLKQTSYQKGFSDSTQTMLLDLGPQSGSQSGAGSSEKPVRVLITNHIKHGPFPALQGVGQAIIDTEFKFEDPQMQAQFEKAFPNEKPRIHTLVGLGGNTASDIQIPSGSLTESSGSMNWKALAGTVKVAGQQVNADMNWSGLTYNADGDTGQLSGVRMVSTSRMTGPNEKLSVGNAKITIDKMELMSSGQQVNMSGLNIVSDTKLTTPDTYQALVEYNVVSLQAAGQDLKNLQLHLGFRNLARAPLERLVTLFSDLQAKKPADGTQAMPDLTAEQQKQLETDLTALLKGNPKLTLDRLSLTQPSGDVVIKGEVSAPQLASASAEQLQMLTAMPQMLMGMLNLHLEGQANQKALEELLALGGGKVAQQANIQGMVDAGYLTKQGNDVSMKLDIKDGQMLLNGQALGQ